MFVQLSVKKPLFRDYLKHLFSFKDGKFLVSRDNDFGKLVCARVQYSHQPVKVIDEPGSVILHLPKSRPLVNGANYYLYFSKEDEHKLNDELEATFNIDFDRYYLQGRKLKEQQKDIIQSFIISRQLVGLIGDNEMLKKRVYRSEIENLKKLTDQLLAKAKYRNERIDFTEMPANVLIGSRL